MSETTFDPFAPATPPPAADKPAKNGRKKRGPNKKKVEAAPKPVGTGRTKPKVRAKRGSLPKAAGRTIKLDLLASISTLAGLKEEDAATLTICISHLQNVSKASRARVVAALGRIFP